MCFVFLEPPLLHLSHCHSVCTLLLLFRLRLHFCQKTWTGWVQELRDSDRFLQSMTDTLHQSFDFLVHDLSRNSPSVSPSCFCELFHICQSSGCRQASVKGTSCGKCHASHNWLGFTQMILALCQSFPAAQLSTLDCKYRCRVWWYWDPRIRWQAFLFTL